MEKDGRMVNRAPAPQVPDRNPALQSNQIAQIVEATPEQLDSIKKYQVSFFCRQLFNEFSANMQAELLFFVSKK